MNAFTKHCLNGISRYKECNSGETFANADEIMFEFEDTFKGTNIHELWNQTSSELNDVKHEWSN